jgi:hypothetical protein
MHQKIITDFDVQDVIKASKVEYMLVYNTITIAKITLPNGTVIYGGHSPGRPIDYCTDLDGKRGKDAALADAKIKLFELMVKMGSDNYLCR